MSRLLAACDERFAPAVALCYVQGWRVSEALGLAWQDLDLDAGVSRSVEEDVAQFVGHTDVSTTRGYVQHEAERPRQVSEKAFLLGDRPTPTSRITARPATRITGGVGSRRPHRS